MIRQILLSGILLAPQAMAHGRFGLAPASHLPAIQSWVSQDPGRYWVKGEDQVFYYDPGSNPGRLPLGPGYWRPLKGDVYAYYGAQALPQGSEELLRGGRIRLIQSPRKLPIDFASDQHGGVRPLRKNHSLVDRQPKLFQLKQTPSLSNFMVTDPWFQDIETLSAWNRYSYGPQIEDARAWLVEQFEALQAYTVEDYAFDMPRGKGSNVIARLEGKSRPEEIYIIGAHYDSISERPTSSAPGAEDNASGAAGLLTLARTLAQYPPEATVIFVAFSGEEQGLYGSKSWLKNVWLKEGREGKIKAAFIMDMIGYSGDDEQDLLLETSTLTKPLLADIQSVNTDPDLVISESFDYWGSDHEPFLDNDIPAILFIENDYLGYPNYHRTADRSSSIHPTLGPKILRLMADSLALWIY